MGKKYALILSGGGFKGAFQIGVLDYLFENELTQVSAVKYKFRL